MHLVSLHCDWGITIVALCTTSQPVFHTGFLARRRGGGGGGRDLSAEMLEGLGHPPSIGPPEKI